MYRREYEESVKHPVEAEHGGHGGSGLAGGFYGGGDKTAGEKCLPGEPYARKGVGAGRYGRDAPEYAHVNEIGEHTHGNGDERRLDVVECPATDHIAYLEVGNPLSVKTIIRPDSHNLDIEKYYQYGVIQKSIAAAA